MVDRQHEFPVLINDGRDFLLKENPNAYSFAIQAEALTPGTRYKLAEAQLVLRPTPLIADETYYDYVKNTWDAKNSLPEYYRAFLRNLRLERYPERERLQQIMSLLHEHVRYARSNDPEVCKNPGGSEWLRRHMWPPRGSMREPVRLIEVFQRHVGVCGHLAVAYLWLCEQAGFRGCLVSLEPGRIQNLSYRGQRLFSALPENTRMSEAHAFARIQLSDGSWIPVDPTSGFVADIPDKLAFFEAAGYVHQGDVDLASFEGKVIGADAQSQDVAVIRPRFQPYVFPLTTSRVTTSLMVERMSMQTGTHVGRIGKEQLTPSFYGSASKMVRLLSERAP